MTVLIGKTTARMMALAICLGIAAPMSATPASPAGERRCGWLVNPTPGNFDLLDRDGLWTISAQGGYQAEGMDDMPDMTIAGWVATNGSYGHGCACMTAVIDKNRKRLRSFTAATPIPLARCRADKALAKPQ